jgi:hypothetical protein
MVSMCRSLTTHSDYTAVFSTQHETLPSTVESACLVGVVTISMSLHLCLKFRWMANGQKVRMTSWFSE